MGNSSKKIKAVVVGASGYSGMELTRLLSKHPRVALVNLFASPRSGASPQPPHESSQATRSSAADFLLNGKSRLPISPFQESKLLHSSPDVVFFATPNETSNEMIPRYQMEPFKLIDLSGSFRLRQAALYPKWYGFSHAAPQLLPKFTYGLSELNASAISKAQWVANPGCYATSVLLPLLPLVRLGLIDETSPLICDSKSGVSGAGKQPTSNTHFCEVSESFKAYSVFSHRHLPEIEQHLGLNGNHPLLFTPHLIPINRGILSTIYLKMKEPCSEETLRRQMANFYSRAPFIRIFPAGELPQVKWVTHTNYCDIGVRLESKSPWAILVSCLDNLVKGAAGQAVQNMNLMFGLNEQTGLE